MSEVLPQVAICHQVFRRAGGMEHYAIGLARSFRQLGWQVNVYAREADAELAAELGVEVCLLKKRALFRKLRDWQFQRFIETSMAGMRGLQIGLARVSVRDLSVCGGTHAGYLRATRKMRGPFDSLQLALERRAYSNARRVVSHSDLCTSELRRFYGVPAGRIQTVYPPVGSRFSPGDARASRRALNLPEDKPVLLFPSMGHRRKGFDQLCRALADLDCEPPILAVAGKPVNSGRYPFVFPLGYIQEMEVAYRAADFTVLGSSYEPFGLVGPESVLSGTRLLFDEKIGCLSAIEKSAVTTFQASDKTSVQGAIREALALYRAGKHRLDTPARHLLYNPDPVEHARTLIQLGVCESSGAALLNTAGKGQ